MRDKEIVGLYSAYLNIHSNLNEEVTELDESGLSQTTLHSAAKKRQKRIDADYREDTPEGDKRGDKGMEKLKRTKNQLNINKPREVRMRANEEFDIFDIILEHLVAEGYADTNESALAIMANMSEEWRQDIMEISQKTATRAYARRSASEFEGDDGPDRVRKNNELHGRIVKKFGAKAGEDANKAADANTFGRRDSRTGNRQERPQSRIEKNRTYRTTKTGSMHGQDQAKLKSDLIKSRNKRNNA